MRITWLFVPNICQDIDRVVLGQAAESCLYWCVTKSKSNCNEDISLSQSEKDQYCIYDLFVESKKIELTETEQNSGYQGPEDQGIKNMWFKGTNVQLVGK